MKSEFDARPVYLQDSEIREMNFLRFEGKGYILAYTKTKLTDDLHAAFEFKTAREISRIKTGIVRLLTSKKLQKRDYISSSKHRQALICQTKGPSPRWRQALSVATLPLGVRFKRPF